MTLPPEGSRPAFQGSLCVLWRRGWAAPIDDVIRTFGGRGVYVRRTKLDRERMYVHTSGLPTGREGGLQRV